MIEYVEKKRSDVTKIKVVGVGGAGCNAVTRMSEVQIHGVELIVVNTDNQHLSVAHAHHKIQIGNKITRGLGSGQDPDLAEKAAQEEKDKIVESLRGADMVIITAGMGGGTGTGASPVIAEAAKSINALTVGIVTKPFKWEGRERMDIALKGIEQLEKFVDTVIVIPNDNLNKLSDTRLNAADGFKLADDVLRQAVQGTADIITTIGFVNVDFNDVKAVMENSGGAIMGVGEASGENRVEEAVRRAVNNPLLENTSIVGATGLLINITAQSMDTLAISEIEEIHALVNNEIYKEGITPKIISGLAEDHSLGETIRISVIATGFNHTPYARTPARGVHTANYAGSSMSKLSSSPVSSSRMTATIGIGRHESDPQFRTALRTLNPAPLHTEITLPSLESDIETPAFLRRGGLSQIVEEEALTSDRITMQNKKSIRSPSPANDSLFDLNSFDGVPKIEVPSFLRKPAVE